MFIIRKLLENNNPVKSIISSKFINTKSLCNHDKKFENIPNFIAIHLKNRQLLRVSGPGSFIYLQSLLTNDMRKLSTIEHDYDKLSNSTSVIYSFLLSAVGRVLCDLFIYRIRHLNDGSDGEFILDVDRKLAKAIKRLLLGYNVNKNVSVELINDFNLWSILPSTLFGNNDDIDHTLRSIDSDDIKLLPDPRIGCTYMGYRFLNRLGGSCIEDLGPFIKCQSNHDRIRLIEGSIYDYTRLKYQIGLAEGHNDILSGHYYPFELNGDYIQAISLDKGLYTSEEKTIKIYSTQPIKQRIFPVEFLCNSHTLKKFSPAPRTFICSTRNRKKIGHLHQRIGRYGIATISIPLSTNNIPRDVIDQDFYHNDTGLKLRASIPKWWPENYDQKYLNAPKYPECLFNFNSQKSDSRTQLT